MILGARDVIGHVAVGLVLGGFLDAQIASGLHRFNENAFN